MATREPIYAALFDYILASSDVSAQFVSKGRFLIHHSQVDPSQMPALYMNQSGEGWTRPGRGIPAKRELQCTVHMYAYSTGPEDTLQATLCNNMLDALDEALNTPDNPENVVTLDGLVYHVYMEGAVGIYEGLLQGVSIVSVPIHILIP